MLVGLLGPVRNGVLALADGSRSYEVPLEDVKAARLVFELKPASKPGKGPGGAGKKKSKKA